MHYWLMKSEPSECSIDDRREGPREDRAVGRRPQLPGAQLHAQRHAAEGRRAVLPLVVPGAGHRRPRRGRRRAVSRRDPVRSGQPYFDPKSRREAPRWYLVDVKLVEKTRLLSLQEMREAPELATMRTLRRGNRLSITPVTDEEWRAVLHSAARPVTLGLEWQLSSSCCCSAPSPGFWRACSASVAAC
jgi:predicted RNA-binding protein with PUA-like domain